MKINDVIKESWNPDNPIESLSDPSHYYDKNFIKMLSDFDRIRKANTLNHHEAELLIASDNELTEEILQYRFDNTPLSKQIGKKLATIIEKIQPLDKTFYRGVESETQDEEHIMSVQSWATSMKVAGYFGDIIYETVGKVKGAELGNIFYLNEKLYDTESDGLTESMGEWLLLNPDRERIK